MAKAVTQNSIFTDENAAREALEAVRWPDGPICPHCGNADGSRIAKVEGKKQSHRPGLHYCNECKGQFTVTVGTVFERSKVPLTKWWLATHLINSSKKGISAHQIHRTLGVTYKTAWFMMHRIREAMRVEGLAPMGGEGSNGIVEADETYYGNVDPINRRSATTSGRPFIKRGKASNKRPILALVERGGRVRTFHVPVVDQASDLWEAAVNNHPQGLSELKGKPKRLLRPDEIDEAPTVLSDDEPEDQLTDKTIYLRDVIRKQFDLRNVMGTVLRTKCRFDQLSGIREAYALAFFKDYRLVDEALKNKSLDAVSAVRNLIVHRSGNVDETYLKKCRYLDVPRADLGKPIQLDGEVVSTLLSSVTACGINLVVAVEKWVSEN